MTARRHGCYNRQPLRDGHMVQNGWREAIAGSNASRMPVMRYIPDPMTRACQYAISPEGQADTACDGCRNHASGAIILPYTLQPMNEKENP
jgi:hypothetical protein